MTVIRGQHLTTFELAPDRATFSIHVTDEETRPGTLMLPADTPRLRSPSHGDQGAYRLRTDEHLIGN